MRDRERERRSQRVERPDEVHVAGEDHEDRRDAREQNERQPRRLEARMQPPQHLGQLPVGRHRVGDARGADDTRVRRDHQDRRREDADVDLGSVEEDALEPDVLDHAENRVVRITALLGRKREQGRELAVDHRHGERRERDERQREVDREDRSRDELVRVRHGASRIAGLLGEIGDGLDAGVGEHRHGNRDREVRPGRRDAPVHVVDEHVGAEHERETDDHEQDLRGEVHDGQRDRQLRRLLHADDVQRDENDDDDRRRRRCPTGSC